MDQYIHRELIIQWANGHQIERLHADGEWRLEMAPSWSRADSYRLFSGRNEKVSTLIFCVPFQHVRASNGILSVVRFAQILQVLGIRVVFMCVLSEHPSEELIFTKNLRSRMVSNEFENLHSRIGANAQRLGLEFTADPTPLIDEGAVVLYSERIINNPLCAKKIIRYFGNKNGVLNGGRLVNQGEHDFILSHSKILHPRAHHYLYFAEIDHEFKETNSLDFNRRETSLTYIGKGHLYGEVGLIDSTLQITREFPNNKKDLANLLRNSKFLFTWDSWTNLIAEAIFCGTIPVLLRSSPFSMDEINNSENAPIPCIDISKIEYDKRTRGYTLKNQADYELFRQQRDLFMARQSYLERYYPFSVQEFLSKLQAHFSI